MVLEVRSGLRQSCIINKSKKENISFSVFSLFKVIYRKRAWKDSSNPPKDSSIALLCDLRQVTYFESQDPHP